MQDKVKLTDDELMQVAGGTAQPSETEQLQNYCKMLSKQECESDPKCKTKKEENVEIYICVPNETEEAGV